MQTWAQVHKDGPRATEKFRIYRALGADTQPLLLHRRNRPRGERGLIYGHTGTC